MTDSSISRPRSRRSVLDLLLRVGVVGWLVSALYPVIRYLTPLPLSGPTGPVRLTRAEIAKLEHEKFAIIPVGRSRVLVFEDTGGELHALDAKCTHEGCTVRYQPGNAIIWCACSRGCLAIKKPPGRFSQSFMSSRRLWRGSRLMRNFWM